MLRDLFHRPWHFLSGRIESWSNQGHLLQSEFSEILTARFKASSQRRGEAPTSEGLHLLQALTSAQIPFLCSTLQSTTAEPLLTSSRRAREEQRKDLKQVQEEKLQQRSVLGCEDESRRHAFGSNEDIEVNINISLKHLVRLLSSKQT